MRGREGRLTGGVEKLRLLCGWLRLRWGYWFTDVSNWSWCGGGFGTEKL